MRERRLDDQVVQMLEHVRRDLAVVRTTRSATDGSISSSPSRWRQSAGRNGRMAAVSITPGAERVGDDDVAGADGIDQAGDAEQRVAAQLERIAEAVVEPAEDDVDRLQAFERLDEDAAIAHGQVAAFDQREAEIAREVRMLEVRLVVRSRRQQHDLGGQVRRRRQRARACRAARGRTTPAGESGSRGTLRAGCAAARSGSRARSRRPTAPACDRRAPTTDRPASAPGRRRACAGRCRAARECRGRGAETPGWPAPATAAAVRSAGAAADRTDRAGSD